MLLVGLLSSAKTPHDATVAAEARGSKKACQLSRRQRIGEHSTEGLRAKLAPLRTLGITACSRSFRRAEYFLIHKQSPPQPSCLYCTKTRTFGELLQNSRLLSWHTPRILGARDSCHWESSQTAFPTGYQHLPILPCPETGLLRQGLLAEEAAARAPA